MSRSPRRVPNAERDRGAVAVLVALCVSSLLIAVGAITVDLGAAYARRQTLQNAATLAAAAGARALPDPAAARTAAIDALCATDTTPGNETTVAGWPPSTCIDRSWADDGDLANGEIWFYGGDTNANGFFDDGSPVSLPSGERAGSRDDERVSDAPATALRVVAPPSTVTFNLASAIGYDSISVQRAATAKVITPLSLGMAPFYLLSGLDDVASTCIDTGAATGGCAARTGARGYLAEPRYSGAASTFLRDNIRFGIDHAIVPWTSWPVRPANLEPTPWQPCSASRGTASTSSEFTPRQVVNCVRVTREPIAGQVTAGFLAGADARLRKTAACPGAANSGTVGAFTGVDVNPLFQPAFRNPNSGATLADLESYIRDDDPDKRVPPELVGALRSDIVNCPRFAAVPVLAVPPGNGAAPDVPVGSLQTYPVAGISYVYFDDDTHGGFEFDAGGTLVALHAWVIDPALLGDTVAAGLGASPSNPAGAAGWVSRYDPRDPDNTRAPPRQVVLVRDRSVPLSALP